MRAFMGVFFMSTFKKNGHFTFKADRNRGGEGVRVTTQLGGGSAELIKLVISSSEKHVSKKCQITSLKDNFLTRAEPRAERREKFFPFSRGGPRLAGLHAELDKQH